MTEKILETEEPIDYWLELNKRAMRLKPKKYQQWQFIVSLSGSLEERIKLGQQALEMLQPQSSRLVVINKPLDEIGSMSFADFEARVSKVIRGSL